MNNNLLFTFASNDPSHDFWLQESTDGTNFQGAYGYDVHLGETPGIVTENGPYNGQWLLAAFQSNTSSHNLMYACFNSSNQGPSYIRQDNAQVGGTPAEVIFTLQTGPFTNQNTLFVAFQANDSSHRLWFGGQEVGAFSASN